jgi:NADH dehydrogenase
MTNTLADKTICMVGGTGFVGHSIVALLSPLVKNIRVLTRRKQTSIDLTVLPNVVLIEADINKKDELKTQFSGVNIVINLVGILNENLSKGSTFRRNHVELTQKILDACASNKVQRLLHMSALNANASSGRSMYLRTKGEAENMVHTFTRTGFTVTSFRPSVIFGPHDQFTNRFSTMLKVLPYLPLACPNSRLSPVYVGDVARAFVSAIDNKSAQGKRIELCGPNTYSLLELVQYIKVLNKSNRWIWALPDSLSKMMANIMQYVPGKPFTPDNYNSLQIDSVCSSNTYISCCKTSLESILPTYIGTDNEQIKLQAYRATVRR